MTADFPSLVQTLQYKVMGKTGDIIIFMFQANPT